MQLCCLCGLRPWWFCSNDGDFASTLGYVFTIAGCITSIAIGSTLVSDRAVGVVGYAVVDGGTFTHRICNGGGVLTIGSGSGGGVVKPCNGGSEIIFSPGNKSCTNFGTFVLKGISKVCSRCELCTYIIQISS